MALDILREFGGGNADVGPHLPKHDLESIVYVLVWICILYPGPGVDPRPPHESTCLRAWSNCKTRGDLELLSNAKIGELETKSPLKQFMPYFRAMEPYIRRLYVAIRKDRENPEVAHFTHDVMRDILLDAFFEVQEPEKVSPEKVKARRELGVDLVPAKRKASTKVGPMTSKRARR
jgi:hypothetical protein